MRKALCLSGGGFRATLFHLGVVRELLDDGWLDSDVDIYSVSGGSFLAADLVLNWAEYQEDFDSATRGIRALTATNVRWRIFRRWLTWPFWRRSRWAVRQYRELWGKAVVPADPDRPSLHLLATDPELGRHIVVDGHGIHLTGAEGTETREAAVEYAIAVTASSGFPGVFQPVYMQSNRANVPTTSALDGGILDNLGTRAVLAAETEYDEVFVSDAGKAFEWRAPLTRFGVMGSLSRASALSFERIRQLEEQRLQKRYPKARIVRIDDVDSSWRARVPAPVLKQLGRVRTDLDRFSPREQAVLTTAGRCAGRTLLGEDAASMEKLEEEDLIGPLRLGPWATARRELTALVYPFDRGGQLRAMLVLAAVCGLGWWSVRDTGNGLRLSLEFAGGAAPDASCSSVLGRGSGAGALEGRSFELTVVNPHPTEEADVELAISTDPQIAWLTHSGGSELGGPLRRPNGPGKYEFPWLYTVNLRLGPAASETVSLNLCSFRAQHLVSSEVEVVALDGSSPVRTSWSEK